MNSTAVARRDTAPAAQQSAALAIRAGQPAWDEMQLAALAQLGLADATDGDRAVFLHQCQRTGLDPFARQIYMIGRPENKKVKRNGQWVDNWTTKWTIQTGIDGFRVNRARAERKAGVRGILGRAVFYDADGGEYKVWVRRDPPAACEITYTVRDAGGGETPYTSVLRYSEYVQTRADQNGNRVPIAQWANMPAHMLEKCTEADVYRKAFPQDFSGIDLDDAMPPAEAVAADAAPARGRVTAAEVTRPRIQATVINDGDPAIPTAAASPGAPTAPAGDSAASTASRAAAEPRPTGAAVGKLGRLLTRVQLGEPEDVAVYLEWVGGAPAIEGLSRDKVTTVTLHLENMLSAAGGDPAEAASRIWAAYHTAHPQDDDQTDAGPGEDDSDGD